jgi:hypothetical protein
MKPLVLCSVAVCCLVGIAHSNPDGPARSVIIEPVYRNVLDVDAWEGTDVWRFGARLSFPIGSFVTLGGRVDGGRQLASATPEGVQTYRTSGTGLAAHFFIPLTASAATYLRHEGNAAANPDGPLGSLSLELYRYSFYGDAQPGFDVMIPVHRYLSLGGGWTRRQRVQALEFSSGVRSSLPAGLNRANDWAEFCVRGYLPLTDAARRYQRDMSVGVRANPDGGVGTLVLEPRFSIESTESPQWELGLNVAAPLASYATVRVGFAVVHAVAGLTLDAAENGSSSPYTFAQRGAMEFGLTYYLPWSDARAALAQWDGR